MFRKEKSKSGQFFVAWRKEGVMRISRWLMALAIAAAFSGVAYAAADSKVAPAPFYLQGHPGELYTVPDGKILVIETVHGCGDLVYPEVASGLMVLWTRPSGDTNPGFDPSLPWLPIRIEAFPPPPYPIYDHYACSAPISARLYIKSGYTLLLSTGINRTSVPEPTGSSATVSISGYLLPAGSNTLSP